MIPVLYVHDVQYAEQTICTCTGVILGMGSANERRRYNVTSSLIGWAHTQNHSSCIIVTHLLQLG